MTNFTGITNPMQRRTNETGQPRAPSDWGTSGARLRPSVGGSLPSFTPPISGAPAVAQVEVDARPPATVVARHAEARIEVMRLLRGIRVAQGLPEAVMAARLGTAPRIVAALEKGDFAGLPEWPETRGIVDRWVAGAGLDPRPALGSLALALQGHRLVGASPASFDRKPGKGIGRSTDLATGEVESAPPDVAMPVRQAFRFAFGLPPSRAARWTTIALIAAAIGTTATQTTVVAGALSKLPAPAERAVRSISDYFAVRFAPLYEGHRWIDVEDPRSRRGDKLRIGRHSD